MAYARLQPLDDSNSYPFMNGVAPFSAYDTYKTFGSVLADINALGFNTCFLVPNYGDNRNCYYNVVAFNLPTMNDYYIANNEFVEASGRDAALYIQGFTNFASTPVTSYYYGYDHTLVVSATTNLGSLFNFENTKDGITYKRRDFDNLSYGAVFLTNANITNLYLNGSLPISYNWTTVGSVSGKLGVFNFTRPTDEVIGDRTPVYGLTKEDFITINASTALENMVNDVPADVETDVIYAGLVDKMTISRDAEYIYLKFYIAGGSAPFYSFKTPRYASPLLQYLGFIVDNENEIAALVITREYESAGFKRYSLFTVTYDTDITEQQMQTLYLWLHTSSNAPDITEDEEDGEGDPWHDTKITGLTVPTKSAIATGFTTMYEVSDTELQNLSQFLWSTNFTEVVTKFFADPREIIVGLSIMPIKPDTGSAQTIKAGGISTGIQGLPLIDQYKLLEDVGHIYIKKAKDRKCLNYPPYTKVTAHIPFCGEHTLDVNDIMGTTLTLSYIFDFMTGSVVAQIAKDGKPRYFFGGSSGIQIPTSAEDFGRMYSSILAAGATLGSSLATMATGGLAAPVAIGAAGAMLTNGMTMTPNVSFSSGNGSVNGMLSSQTAFLVVETPNEQVADEQEKYTGRMSLTKKTLSECNGYTKVYEVHLMDLINDTCAATDSELSEVEAQLKAGVLIETGSQTENEPNTTPQTQGNLVINFLKMKSEKNVIGKTWDTTTGAEVKMEGKLIYDQSVTEPSLLVYGNMIPFNYCYIPAFGRFYYVMGVTPKSSQIMEVKLKSDPLQSFKTQILACKAIIERQEKKYNTYLNDSMIWTKQNKSVAVIPFLDDSDHELIFDRDNNSYILTIAGG